MTPILDLEVPTGRLLISDDQGSVFEQQMPPLHDETQIARVRIDIGAETLSIVLPDGFAAKAALHLGAARQGAYLAVRPIVYLDQNHWSTITHTIHGGRRVRPEDAAAATVLAATAQQRRIVLPLSAGHGAETGRLYGPRRSQVASRMLELSQGWLMRNPIWVKTG